MLNANLPESECQATTCERRRTGFFSCDAAVNIHVSIHSVWSIVLIVLRWHSSRSSCRLLVKGFRPIVVSKIKHLFRHSCPRTREREAALDAALGAAGAPDVPLSHAKYSSCDSLSPIRSGCAFQPRLEMIFPWTFEARREAVAEHMSFPSAEKSLMKNEFSLFLRVNARESQRHVYLFV